MKYSLRPSLMISLGLPANSPPPCMPPSAGPLKARVAACSLRSSRVFAQFLHLIHRHLRQLRDLLNQVDRPHYEPNLRLLIFLAAGVGNADEAFDVDLGLVLIGDAN